VDQSGKIASPPVKQAKLQTLGKKLPSQDWQNANEKVRLKRMVADRERIASTPRIPDPDDAEREAARSIGLDLGAMQPGKSWESFFTTLVLSLW
jgi:hypothetical protein